MGCSFVPVPITTWAAAAAHHGGSATTALGPPEKPCSLQAVGRDLSQVLNQSPRMASPLPCHTSVEQETVQAPRWPWEGHQASIPHSWLSPCPALQSIRQSCILLTLPSQKRHCWRGDTGVMSLCLHWAPSLSSWAESQGASTSTMLGMWHPAQVGSRGSLLRGKSSTNHPASKATLQAELPSFSAPRTRGIKEQREELGPHSEQT